MIHPSLQFLIDNKNLLPEDLGLLIHPYLHSIPGLKVHIFCLHRLVCYDMGDVERIKTLNRAIDRCNSTLSNTDPTEQSRFGIADQLKRCRETIRSLEYGRKLRLLTYTRYKNLIEDALNEAQGPLKS